MKFEGIYNYYERMVYEAIAKLLQKQSDTYDEDDAQDIACIALNQLPARYVRHSVDTAFYIEDEEKNRMRDAVDAAVQTAFERVKNNPGTPD